jgi:hypothetical protein
MAEFDLSDLQEWLDHLQQTDAEKFKDVKRHAYSAMAETLNPDVADSFISDIDDGIYDDIGAKRMREMMYRAGGSQSDLKDAWQSAVSGHAEDFEYRNGVSIRRNKPNIQFGMAPQAQPKPDPADFFNAPGFDKSNVRQESVLNVGGGKPTLPEYLQKPAPSAPASTNTASAAERLDGILKGGNMEDQAKKLGGFLDDMPKIKRLIEGVPLGLRYGAATLPAAALLTRVALDEADSISDRWTRNRIRAEKRKEALRKLAYSELKQTDSIANLLPQEYPRTTVTEQRRYP